MRRTVRVLSYNIHKGVGGRDRRYRLERIADVVAREEPDLVCLQEVDRNVKRSKFDDQPKLLAEAFEAEGRLYQLNVHHQRGGYGNLILSRWPFVTRHQISLRMKHRKPRGAQLVTVDTGVGTLHLVNWHLGLAEAERHYQARHLLEHHLFREAGELPTLVIGDCNDWRNTLADGSFREHGFTHATAPPSRYRSFPAYLPLGSLDKAFVRGDLTVDHVRVANTKLTRAASDHLPLIVDLTLSG